MNTLPYDFCRCEGAGCESKTECMRHVALRDMGPRTPISPRMCEPGVERIWPIEGCANRE